MKVWHTDYEYSVCPFCKSKKIESKGMVAMGGSCSVELSRVNKTGYLCENCNRYFPERDLKYIVDQAEMKRDIKNLQGFLDKKTNRSGA